MPIDGAEKDVSMKNLSRKEAITLLRNLEDSLDSYCGLNEEGKTAFRMAIEALSCSEIPNNSDTISRQAAIDVLHGYFDGMLETDTVCPADIYGLFECMPLVQPERKTVFNRDIAIEAICDEVMLWFDVSATQAYEIAETAVKRIEVRMEKTEKGEQE